MIEVEEIKPGQRVYWLYNTEVRYGIVECIKIYEYHIDYNINGNNHGRKNIFLTEQDALIASLSLQIDFIKNDIQKKCKKLKLLKEQKKQLLTASLAGVELDNSNK